MLEKFSKLSQNNELNMNRLNLIAAIKVPEVFPGKHVLALTKAANNNPLFYFRIDGF